MPTVGLQLSSQIIEISIDQDYVDGVNYTDWAICQLEDNLGDMFGWFGMSGEPVMGLELMLSGYPGYSTTNTIVSNGYQYQTVGHIYEITNERFFYTDNYANGGYSGGPLYDSDGYALGICSVNASSTDGYNTGATSFSPWLFDLIVEKCEESAARWD